MKNREIMFRILTCLLLISHPLISVSEKASITFLVADLKYNQEKGIQVCEIQQGGISIYGSYDYLHGQDGLVSSLICDSLEKFHHSFSYIPSEISDTRLKKKFKEHGWRSFKTQSMIAKNSEFIQKISQEIADPTSISSYSEVLYCRKNSAKMLGSYPGLLVIDEVFNPFAFNKRKVSELFLNDPDLENFKPKWGVFPCKYSKKLVQSILKSIPSDYLVIKPVSLSQGTGVIILHKKDLDKTLKHILDKSKKLEKDPDPAYKAWSTIIGSEFIVEEFIESDPVNIPDLGNLPYDGTLRVLFIIYRDKGELLIDPIECHWNVPKLSLKEKGTLNLKHKCMWNVPHYALVDPEIEEVVFRQLKEMMSHLFPKMEKSYP